MHFVRHGLNNRQIAERFSISLDAVKYHVENIKTKLGVETRLQLKQWRGAPNDSALGRERATMSNTITLGVIGQISRSVASIEESVDWYNTKVGLRHLYTYGKLAFFDCGGTRLFLQEISPSPESVLYLRVPDITAAYDQLQQRGIAFTSAPHLIHRHDDGVEEWMAFFNDIEGRTLAIMCQVPPHGSRAGAR